MLRVVATLPLVDSAVQLHSPETPLGVCFLWDDWAIAALGQI